MKAQRHFFKLPQLFGFWILSGKIAFWMPIFTTIGSGRLTLDDQVAPGILFTLHPNDVAHGVIDRDFLP